MSAADLSSAKKSSDFASEAIYVSPSHSRLYKRTIVASEYALPNQIIWYLIARVRIVFR